MAFNFLYTTDLHGNELGYLKILGFAQDHGIKLIHLGADILPKGSEILSRQKKFVGGYLKNFYKACNEKGIDVLAFFGNDDIYTRKKYFRKYANLLDEQEYVRDGYKFTAYGFVPDYPFTLKTACKSDYDGWKCSDPQLGDPIIVTERGIEKIPDLDEYLKKKGTIEDDLKNFKGGSDIIAAIHCPPAGAGLDVCHGNKYVGSKSVLRWVMEKQPAVLLCGHIHESYQIMGIWQTILGRTRVIQPGQSENSDKTNIVVIEIAGRINTTILQI